MEIKKITVLGAGLMGNGIAQVCAQAGYEVIMRDIEDRFVENGMNTIKKNLQKAVEKGKMSEDEMNAVLGRITGLTDLKEAMKDPEHEEHESYVRWWGGPYDPAALDLDDVNRGLQNIDQIDWWWEDL